MSDDMMRLYTCAGTHEERWVSDYALRFAYAPEVLTRCKCGLPMYLVRSKKLSSGASGLVGKERTE